MNLTDILFYLFVLIVASTLLWELIPDGFKAYWKYHRQMRKENGEEYKNKYSFTWRIGRGG